MVGGLSGCKPVQACCAVWFQKSPGGALDHMSFGERNDRQLEELKARILADSEWLTGSGVIGKAGFRSAAPDAGERLESGREDIFAEGRRGGFVPGLCSG